MRRMILILTGVSSLLGSMVGHVAAHEPTCADVGALAIVVHGQHVVRDYVIGGGLDEWPPSGAIGDAIRGSGAALPGGPGPAFHFANGFAPGASFCNDASSPGLHL
jgi:hypothetical protein